MCWQCANMNVTDYHIVGDEEKNFLGKSFEFNTVAFCVHILYKLRKLRNWEK